MNLDDTQKSTVRGWIDQGLKLAEIQKRMEEELGLRITYMELRFLVDDLKIMPKDPEPAQEEAVDKMAEPEETADAEEPAGAPGGVTVSVDTLARPGALASGKVRFTDGKQADWYFDQTGRLGLVAEDPAYRPPEADVREFQQQLHSKLQQMGM